MRLIHPFQYSLQYTRWNWTKLYCWPMFLGHWLKNPIKINFHSKSKETFNKNSKNFECTSSNENFFYSLTNDFRILQKEKRIGKWVKKKQQNNETTSVSRNTISEESAWRWTRASVGGESNQTRCQYCLAPLSLNNQHNNFPLSKCDAVILSKLVEDA